jgi:DNA-binding SARP family transcriptional activator
LIERFWPETDPEKGHSNLSSALSRLRRALRPADPGIITLDAYGQAGIAAAAPVWFDAAAFRAGVRPALASPGRLQDSAAAELCAGLELYRGESSWTAISTTGSSPNVSSCGLSTSAAS